MNGQSDIAKGPRRAVVHVGMPKAGSTTIQNFLSANADSLESRGAVYHRAIPGRTDQPEYVLAAFAEMGTPVPSHQRPYLGVTDGADESRVLAALERAISEPRGSTWIISSEYLVGMLDTPSKIGALHSYLAARFDEVRYLLYLRRQDRFFESLYSQILRHGDTRTLDAFAWNSPPPDYDAVAQLWEDGLGSTALQVRLLEPEELIGGDLIEDFCSAAGIDAADLPRPQDFNKGFTTRQAAMVRRFNSAIARVPLTKRLERWKYPLIRAIGSAGGGEPLRLSPEQRRHVLAKVATSNERLRARHFPNRTTLFAMSDLDTDTAPSKGPRK